LTRTTVVGLTSKTHPEVIPKKYREIRAALRLDGWKLVRQRGSHQVWLSPDGTSRVIVSGKNSDTIPTGTLASIRKATGMDYLR
jgi:predicted RNA binding protein YcfA (HicA-like mRNA interferase family)